MNKNIKKTVYKILENNQYARENDNYLIVKVVEVIEPELIKTVKIFFSFYKIYLFVFQ